MVGHSQVRMLDETIIGLVDHTSRILSCRVASSACKSPSEAQSQEDSASTSRQGRGGAGQSMLASRQSIMASRRCHRTFQVRVSRLGFY